MVGSNVKSPTNHTSPYKCTPGTSIPGLSRNSCVLQHSRYGMGWSSRNLQMQINYIRWYKKGTAFKNRKNKRLLLIFFLPVSWIVMRCRAVVIFINVVYVINQHCRHELDLLNPTWRTVIQRKIARHPRKAFNIMKEYTYTVIDTLSFLCFLLDVSV